MSGAAGAASLAMLAPFIAELVRAPEVTAALREALGGTTARAPYTLQSPPPGYKSRAFATLCRTVTELGAVKPAGTRSWSVDADRFDAWAAKTTRRTARRRDLKPASVPSGSAANDAGALAAALGLERRKGAA